MSINSTNLQQFEGGAVVKQGDSASLFGYELLDENMRPISDLNGKMPQSGSLIKKERLHLRVQ